MSDEQVASMLDHMITTGILHSDQGLLWLGRAGEEEYGRRHFMELFTSFISEPLVAVRHGERLIGSVHSTTFARWPGAEVVLVLGGRGWQVTHVEWKDRLACAPDANVGCACRAEGARRAGAVRDGS